MLIQNISNMAQTPQPVRLTSDSAPAAASANVDVQSSVLFELPQAAAQQVAEQQPSTGQLKNVVDSINKTLKQANKNLEFSVDESTNKQVVKLVDMETGDLVRQFPTEEMLAISHSINQFQQGLLLKQEA